MDSFTALSDPTRRRIVEMLAASGQLSASEISGRFEMSAPAISQHLKVLRDARLVQMEKRAQQRIYSVNAEGLDDMEQWVAQMRGFWNAKFDALEKLLAQDKKKKKKEK